MNVTTYGSSIRIPTFKSANDEKQKYFAMEG